MMLPEMTASPPNFGTNHEHIGESHSRTGCSFEFFDRNPVIGGDLVLFATGLDDCEHLNIPVF